MDTVAHEAPATPLLALQLPLLEARRPGFLARGETTAPCETAEPPISACCGLA